MRSPIAPRALDRLLAERQDGVVARWQLAQLGMSESGIARRLAAGRLHRIHPGAYAVGHTVLTWWSRNVEKSLRDGACRSIAQAGTALVGTPREGFEPPT
jgi:Transcriptional regulator, AbiEi antitoxin